MNRKTLARLGFWCAVGAAFGISAKSIFIKLAYLVPQEIVVSPLLLLALRMLFAAPFFLLMAIVLKNSKKQKKPPQPLKAWEWAWVALLGMMGYYFSSYWDFISLRYISAGLERLILMTYPSITVIIGALFLGKKVSAREIVSMLLMYLGISIAFGSDLHFSGNPNDIIFGSAIRFCSCIVYALYLLGADRYIQKLGSTRFTLYSMASSTAGIVLHYFLTQPIALLFAQHWKVYAYAFGMALFSTVFPVVLLGLAIRFSGAARAAMIGMLGPILTIFLGWIVLSEPVSIWQIIGAFFVIFGVMMLSNLLDSLQWRSFFKKT